MSTITLSPDAAEHQPANAFSVATARALVNDLFTPNPWIYWPDFLLTTALGYAAAAIYLSAENFSALQLAALVVAAFALFRTGTYIHEIVHLRKGTLPGFVLAWNVLIGVPMGTPSSFYANHADHHSKTDYGTPQDGEYLPFTHSSRRHLLAYAIQPLIIPILAIVRFVVLAPLSLFIPPLRRFVAERASSYVSNPYYRKEPGRLVPPRVFLLAEAATSALYIALAIGFATGYLPLEALAKVYVLAVLGIGLNWLRNLGGHRFDSLGLPISHAAQFKDSVTIEGNALTELLFPLGLRYHAIHHLFPTMPYHALPVAHCRFLADLPAEFGYRDTIYPSLWWLLRRLWREAGRGHDRTAIARWQARAKAA
ncbi:fatty acid desaturase family protein [Desertibaculum subflavum]|uniref:fatty acid desaturase family protein n=1 Tax=Desertibaculum subflavum TaxID=2268458 RepID=UPI000E661058